MENECNFCRNTDKLVVCRDCYNKLTENYETRILRINTSKAKTGNEYNEREKELKERIDELKNNLKLEREVREKAEKALSHQKSLGKEEKERALNELKRELEKEKAEALKKNSENYERIIQRIKDNRRHGQVKRLQDATNQPTHENVFRYRKEGVSTGTGPGKRQELVPTQQKSTRVNAPLQLLQQQQQRQPPLQQHPIKPLLQATTQNETTNEVDMTISLEDLLNEAGPEEITPSS